MTIALRAGGVALLAATVLSCGWSGERYEPFHVQRPPNILRGDTVRISASGTEPRADWRVMGGPARLISDSAAVASVLLRGTAAGYVAVEARQLYNQSIVTLRVADSGKVYLDDAPDTLTLRLGERRILEWVLRDMAGFPYLPLVDWTSRDARIVEVLAGAPQPAAPIAHALAPGSVVLAAQVLGYSDSVRVTVVP